jgi:lipoate-protein ligase B
MAYEPAWARQKQVHADVVAGRSPDTLLVVEHEPVITLGRRPEAAEHLLAGEPLLAARGVSLCQTDRGGDITYHGPGQVVIYPIVRLNDHGLNLRQYVWLLEQAIIETLGRWAIDAGRDDCAVGVWVKGAGERGADDHGAGGRAACPGPAAADSAKIAAIGVRASRWVTMHGLALNVAPDLDYFGTIVPCGIQDREVASMAGILGRTVPMDEVRPVVAAEVARVFGRTLEELP